MAAEISAFGYARDGRRVDAMHLRSDDLKVVILTRGAVVQDVRLTGVGHALTLGGTIPEAYDGPMRYFGPVVGPVANRIGGARALIGGRDCRFPANEGPNLLHGGNRGLHSRHWEIEAAEVRSVTLRLVLEDGDDGFPGRREISATFQVDGAALTLALSATTDAPTLMNLANHSYWNLDNSPDISGHRLCIAADHYLPVDDALLPTGEVRPVAGAFDLRAGRELDLSEGYDHNFCLSDHPRDPTEVAELTGRSGLRLTLATTEPGLQVYDGAGLGSAPFAGHGGRPCGPFAGLALEPQRWPDALRHPGFPSIALAAGQTYRQETRWSFRRV